MKCCSYSSLFPDRSGLLAARVCLSVACFALGWAATLDAYTYTTANLTTSADSPSQIEAIPLQVTATQVSPPSITITTYAPGTYTISRKAPASNTWTPVASGVTLAASGTWTDNNVTLGTLYEYQFINTASTPYQNVAPYSIYATGYLLTGIQVDQTLPKGMMAVICANDLPGNMPAQYAQYKQDLVDDGWQVREIQVPRCPDNYSGLGNGALSTVWVTAGGTTSIASGSIAYLTNQNGKEAEGTVTVSGSAVTAISTAVTTGGVTVWGNAGSGFSVGDTLTLSGGKLSPGTQAYVTANVTTTQSTLTYAYPVTGGSGYTNGQAVTLTGQTSGATVQATLNAQTGIVSGFSLPGTAPGFISNETLAMTGNTTGSGIGPLAAYVYSGNLTSVSIYSPGTGYTQGEAAVMTGNQSGATASVTLNVNQVVAIS